MKKALYVTEQGEGEFEVYELDDFKATGPVADSPVKTGPDGTIDPSLLPTDPVVQVSKLSVIRKATGSIIRGDLVRTSTFNHVIPADSTETLDDAVVFGLAMNNAENEEDVEIQMTVRDLIEKLNESEKTVILLRFYEEAGIYLHAYKKSLSDQC